MNSLNVRQVEGGTVLKEGDSDSRFSFELLDEHFEAMPLNGKQARIKLINHKGLTQFDKTVTIIDNRVTWQFDTPLPSGTYLIEFIVDGYIFPSDRHAFIKVSSSSFSTPFQEKEEQNNIQKELDQLRVILGGLKEENHVLSDRLAVLEKTRSLSEDLSLYYLTMVKGDTFPQNSRKQDWQTSKNRAMFTYNQRSGLGIIHLDFGSLSGELKWKDTAILAELPENSPLPLELIEVQLAIDPRYSIYIEKNSRKVKGTYPPNQRIMCDLIGFFS